MFGGHWRSSGTSFASTVMTSPARPSSASSIREVDLTFAGLEEQHGRERQKDASAQHRCRTRLQRSQNRLGQQIAAEKQQANLHEYGRKARP